MSDALEDHKVTVSIGGRTITNLHFVNGIDSLVGKEELANKASTAYRLEISAEKIKLMANIAEASSRPSQ